MAWILTPLLRERDMSLPIASVNAVVSCPDLPMVAKTSTGRPFTSFTVR